MIISFCQLAELDHRLKKRVYAHSLHYPNIICICKAILDIPIPYFLGIILHEVGHCIAWQIIGNHSEKQANEVIKQMHDIEIEYRDNVWGDKLERIKPYEIEKAYKIAKKYISNLNTFI